MDNILIGRTILAIFIAEDSKAIKFETDKGDVVAKMDGDCCSSTWVESIEVLAELPALVIDADDIELNQDLDTQGGELVFYGFRIKTNKGDITIDYRNESNGYYGGSIWFPREDDEYNSFYGGVYGQNISNEKWVRVES